MKRILSVIAFLLSFSSFAQSLENERLVLVDLYNSTNGIDWYNKTGWKVPGSVNDDPCGWYGITCSGGRVTGINLTANNLSGSLPSQLKRLVLLNELLLSNNRISGTIPDLTGISTTSSISIDNNNFTFDGIEANINYLDSYAPQGKIPLSYGNGFLTANVGGTKSNNTYRWYRDEKLIATNPGADFHIVTGDGNYRAEVTNSKIPELTIGTENYLIGTNPLENDRLALIALFNSTNGWNWNNSTGWRAPGSPGENPCGWYGVTCSDGRVISLGLSNNNLVGPLPSEIGNLGKLSSLWLGTNQLSGSIPKSTANLSELITLNLSENQFSGSIPPELGNLSRLQNLFLYLNDLTGSLPVQLGNLSDLLFLSVGSNELTGSIPAQFGNLSQLYSLFLGSNQLTGSIPIELTNLTSLMYLALDNNQLSGPIPRQFGNLKLLQMFSLQYNEFTGNIPIELGSLSDLTDLNLSHNLLTGTIPPELSNNTKTTTLAVSYNHLTGTIPSDLGKLLSLQYLHLDDNEFTGSIPKELGNLTQLLQLYLHYNQLTGSIPTELRNLVNLNQFYLNHNQLSGTVPDFSPIPESCWMSISQNKFTFDGLEFTSSPIDYYYSQANIPMQVNGAVLSVNAGGTLANNIYFWFKDDVLVDSVAGDNSHTMTSTGLYRVEVINKIAGGLILISDNYLQNTPLPVTLVSFSVKHALEGNQLNWATTSETNNAGFDIERSGDGKSFVKIGFVDGSGKSASLLRYSFVDRNPFPISYYRLKQLDYDGTSAYSRIIHIRSAQTELKLYPNPVKGQLFVENSGDEAIHIFDLKGNRILEKPASAVHSISTSNWADGTYIIKVGNESKKVVVDN